MTFTVSIRESSERCDQGRLKGREMLLAEVRPDYHSCSEEDLGASSTFQHLLSPQTRSTIAHHLGQTCNQSLGYLIIPKDVAASTGVIFMF